MGKRNNLPPGEIEFYDNALPGLKAGTYTIALTQTITGVGDTPPPYTKTQQFIVQGAPFTLDAADVHAVFPPAFSTGQFAENLPFIVLNERSLPWEQGLSGQSAAVPWLALLVFQQEDELLGAPPTQDVEEAREPTHTGSSVATCSVAELVAPDSRVLKPDLGSQPLAPNVANLQCQYIDITSATFQAVVPTLAELPYLAHCRQVNTGNTAILGVKEHGWFAVVMSNRFPSPPAQGDATGRRNVVHLVSLQGYQNYLTDSPPSFPKMESPNDTSKDKNIRLVSLANWSFTCLAESGQTFGGLVQGLFKNSQGQTESADSLRLKLPVAAPATPNDGSATSVAQSQLYGGAVALAYHTLSGEDTFSWYRGPLTPFPTHYVAKQYPFLSASGAMIYDQTNGLFDHSLAAAWQLGRSLALASQSFSTTLLTLRRDGRALINQWLRDQAAQQVTGTTELRALAQRNPAKEQASQWLNPQMLLRISALSKSTVTKAQIQAAKARLLQAGALESGTERVSRTRTLMLRDDAQDALTAELQSSLAAIAGWMARLALLYDVPFDHLVADPNMLPTESMRFFYMDQNWLDALADGALSVGMQSGLDSLLLQTMYQAIRQAVYQAALDYRASISEGTDLNPGTADAPEIRAGFLIRSALISGWPGLIVQALQSNTRLKPLRIDRLAPDVLLCIFLGVPDTVVLSLPQESLSFGVMSDGTIDLRYLTGSNAGATNSLSLSVYDPNGGASQPYLRPGGYRVLNLNATNGSATSYLVPALANALSLSGSLTPSQFAIQMLKSVEYQEFVASGSS